MHRAIVTWFILLVFFILLCLRLELRTHWNWFLVFLPLWLYDIILILDALFYIFIHCKNETFKSILKNKNTLLVIVIMLKVAALVMICLKLEYKFLQLEVHHVLIPLWILLPILIGDVTITLFNNSCNGEWATRLC